MYNRKLSSISVSLHITVLVLLTAVFLVPGYQAAAQSIASAKDAPSSVVREYNSIVSKYNLSNEKGRKDFETKISASDKGKLEALYIKMSKKQQAQQVVGFVSNPTPPAEVVPTDKQLEEWENASVYNVSIDGKPVENKVLRDFSNTDFSYVRINKVSGKAAKNGSNKYMIDLLTKAQYQQVYNSAGNRTEKNRMVIRQGKKGV